MLNNQTGEINAGYDIIMSEIFNTNKYGVEDRIVLGHMATKYGDEYVTWDSCMTPEGHTDYFWGHYFKSANAALKDYHDRLAKEYSHLAAPENREES